MSAYITGGRSDQMYKENLQQQATQRAESISIALQLTDDQKTKLQTAARGDVNRVMQEISTLRQLTAGMDTSNPNENMAVVQQLVQPFLMRVQAGVHQKGSLFAKCLEHILDESQKERYRVYLVEKEKQHHHLITLTTVATINERVPLLKAQREKLVELIEARPIPQLSRNSQSASAYLRLSQIPISVLAEFLDEEQAKFIVRICEPYQALR